MTSRAWAAAAAAIGALALACACNRSRQETGERADSDAVPEHVDTIPDSATPPEGLSTDLYAHTELVRIARNFGKENFEIALDAWCPRDGTQEITEVRLWWSRTDKRGERSPFGAKSREHFSIFYDRIAPDRWTVDLESDRKIFTFFIELDGEGRPAAFAEITTGSGNTVPHCRALAGTLHARRLLGAPIGIRSLEITCIDDGGEQHTAKMVHRRSGDAEADDGGAEDE